MAEKFVNGSWVTRMWADGSGESVAAFQYFGDACRFADMKAADADRPPTAFYLVCNTYNGEMKMYRIPETKP